MAWDQLFGYLGFSKCSTDLSDQVLSELVFRAVNMAVNVDYRTVRLSGCPPYGWSPAWSTSSIKHIDAIQVIWQFMVIFIDWFEEVWVEYCSSKDFSRLD